MSERKSLVAKLWLASSLALLVSVLASPIQSTWILTASSRPDSQRHISTLPPAQPTAHLTAAKGTDAVRLGNALLSEEEEQDGADALDEPRVSFLIPCSFRKVPDRQSIAPLSILSHYPLRC